ncbi:MAG: hypothetical protein CR986_09180 [Ignavibacteriae bacterium]|nr:MAG: hypothetical protein CR986_09180 [Ignavibacteriota bacterium]
MNWFNNIHISMAYQPIYFFLTAIIVIIYTIFIYRITLPKINKFQKSILILARTLALILIIFLIFNPIVKSVSKEKIELKNIIFVDNSKSIKMFSSTEDLKKLKQFINELNKNSEVENKIYTFGDSITSIKNLEADSLSFNDNSTEFFSIFEKLKSEKNISSAVIISDGIVNEGLNVQNKFSEFDFPVFTLGIGDTSDNKDISIEQIKTNEFVYSNRETKIEIIVSNKHFQNKITEISLFEENKLIDKKNIILNKSGINRVSFTYKNPNEGKYKLTVKVKEIFGDDNLNNNRKSTIINILSSKKKIVIIGGSPSRDLSAIYQTLKSNKEFEVVQIVEINNNLIYNQNNSNKNIKDSDILIFVGYPTKKSNKNFLANIIETIKLRKKPTLINFSLNIDYGNLNLLQEILPTKLENISDSFSLTDVEPLGTSNSLLGNDPSSLSDWRQLPPINITNTRLLSNISTEILLESPVNPIILKSSNNSFKNITIAAANIWKWKLNTKNQFLFQNFLYNAVKWLTLKSDEDLFKVKSNKKNYNLSETITFTAVRYNEILEAINNESIKLTITNKNKKNTKTLFFKNTDNGLYEVQTKFNQPGIYNYSAELIDNKKNITAQRGIFNIDPIEPEAITKKMDASFLKSISNSTNGLYVSINKADSLKIKLSKNYEAKIYYKTKVSELHLADLTTILILIVLLFAVEWLIRKKLKML